MQNYKNRIVHEFMRLRNSEISNTLSLTKIVLGTTLVSYPAMFRDNGIVPMIASIVLIGGFLCSTSLYFLYKSAICIRAKTYEELGERVLGSHTRRTIRTSVFLIGYFSLIIYIDLCSTLFRVLVECGETQAKIYVTLMCGLLSTFSSNVGKLKIVNLIGLASILILIGTVFYQFVCNYKDLVLADLNYDDYTSSLFNKIGFISLCFCSHFVIIPFMHNLNNEEHKWNNEECQEDPSEAENKLFIETENNLLIETENNSTFEAQNELYKQSETDLNDHDESPIMRLEINFKKAYKNYKTSNVETKIRNKNMKIIFLSSALSVLVYIFVGLFGYLSFPSTQSNWAQNPFNSQLLSHFLSGILILVIVLSYPLCVVASKDILTESIPSLRQVRGSEIASIWLLTLSSCLCATYISGGVLNSLFLSFGSLVMFIYPTIFYFKTIVPLSRLNLILGGVTFSVGSMMMFQSFIQMSNLILGKIK